MNANSDRVAVNDVSARDVLLFDGLCNFCDASVQFILDRDKKLSLQFAALQGEFARGVLKRHPELADVDSIVLVRKDHTGTEEVLVRSAAALTLGRYLGGPWGVLAALGRLIPNTVSDWLYDALAKRRFGIFGRREACRLPTPAERSRFLD